MSFTGFLRQVAAIPDSEANHDFRSKHTFLTNKQAEFLPDFVGKIGLES